MTAPDEAPVSKFSAWLPPPGRSYSDEDGAYEITVNGMYGTINTLEPEAFERLGRFTDAIESAELLSARSPCNPLCAAKVSVADRHCCHAHGSGGVGGSSTASGGDGVCEGEMHCT